MASKRKGTPVAIVHGRNGRPQSQRPLDPHEAIGADASTPDPCLDTMISNSARPWATTAMGSIFHPCWPAAVRPCAVIPIRRLPAPSLHGDWDRLAINSRRTCGLREPFPNGRGKWYETVEEMQSTLTSSYSATIISVRIKICA
jgi:hypothetical protein